MRNILNATVAAAALIACSGLASAQHETSSVTLSTLKTPTETIQFEIRDGKATLKHNGEAIAMPSLDGDWTEYEVIGEGGNVICLLTRDEPGSEAISISTPGAPQGMNIARFLELPDVAAFPDAGLPPQFPARIAQNQPKVMLGVRLAGEPPMEIAELGFDPNMATKIVYVVPNAPASKAGLKEGDVIVRIGGQPAGDSGAIRTSLSTREPGDEIEVLLIRNGEKVSKVVKLQRFQSEAFDQNVFENRAFFEPEEAQRQDPTLDRKIAELTAALTLTQQEIARAKNTEEIAEMAERIRSLSERLMDTNRARMEMLAQQELRNAQVFEWNNQPQLSLQLQRDGEGGRDLGLAGRIFLEREGGGQPVIIERELDLDRMLPEGVQNMIMGLVDGKLDLLVEELDDDIRLEVETLLDKGMNMAQNRFEDIEVIVEETEGRFGHLQDRMKEVESRLERIERMLQRLLDDR